LYGGVHLRSIESCVTVAANAVGPAATFASGWMTIRFENAAFGPDAFTNRTAYLSREGWPANCNCRNNLEVCTKIAVAFTGIEAIRTLRDANSSSVMFGGSVDRSARRYDFDLRDMQNVVSCGIRPGHSPRQDHPISALKTEISARWITFATGGRVVVAFRKPNLGNRQDQQPNE
jgi:hypothetical protein